MPRQDAIFWEPDTCDCRFYMRGDGTFLSDEEVRAEHQARIDAGDSTAIKDLAPAASRVCNAHRHIGKNQALAETVKEESRRKGKAYRILLSELSGVSVENLDDTIMQNANILMNTWHGVTIEEAQGIPQAKSSIGLAVELSRFAMGMGITEYSWSFDNNRQLIVDLPARTQNNKLAPCQQRCDTEFGGSKVKINKKAK